MATGSLLGTTFTGHPIRTTVGNSVRSYIYCISAFLEHQNQINFKDLYFFISGDDVKIIKNKAISP